MDQVQDSVDFLGYQIDSEGIHATAGYRTSSSP